MRLISRLFRVFPSFLAWTLLFTPALLVRHDARAFALVAASALVLWPLTSKRLLPWSVGLLAVIGAVDIVHVHRFGYLADDFLFATALRTNTQEMQEFITTLSPSAMLWALIWLLICTAIGKFMTVHLRKAKEQQPHTGRWLNRIAAAIWALFLVFSVVKKMDLQEFSYALRPIYPMHIVRAGVSQFLMQKDVFYTPEITAPKTAPLADTIVVVLGESASAARWSLLGYTDADTNAPLRDIEGLQATRAMAHGVTTAAALPYLLTGRSAEVSMAQRLPTFIDQAHVEGYKVFVYTNSRFNNRYEDFYSRALRRSADVYMKVGDGALDEVLSPYLSNALADPAPRKLIVMHPYGSHPSIKERYPHSIGRFDNHYDNSMLYTSMLLAQWTEMVNRHSAGSAMLLYTSDHGLIMPPCDNAFTTGTSRSSLEVPFVFWGNAQLQKKAPQLWQRLSAQPSTTATHSNAEMARLASEGLGYPPLPAPPLELDGKPWSSFEHANACTMQ